MACAAFAMIALVLVGPPDPAAGWRFFTQTYTSASDAAGAAGILIWCAVCLITSLTAAGLRRPRAFGARFRGAVAVCAVLTGASVLIIGLVRHAATFSMCCGGTRSMLEQALHLAR